MVNDVSRQNGDPEIVVIGGGPAGSTVSTLIAKRGYRVQLFERERFPRFHIGESLIPETYWVLERLDMLEKLKKSQFVRKHSVQFVNANGRLSAPFYFYGVEVHEGARVLDVLFEGDRAVGVKVQTAEGAREVRASVVVDASGQSGLLQNKFRLRVWDPILNKGAIWTYWEGAYRDSGRDEGATIVIQTPNKQGWFWYIPLHDDRVSVGVVAPFDYLFRRRGKHEETYVEEVEGCPAVKERVAKARRVTGYFATKDYSYRSKQVAGKGWVLVGDAFGFLDPLYSSGVLLALRSGEMAADAIVEGLEKGDLSADQLGRWGESFNRGVDRMRRLVCEYYDGFNFGNFVRSFPELKGKVTDLLIGDLFTEKVDVVWEPMESLYPPDRKPPPPWNSGTPSEVANTKANELLLPEGPRP